MDAPPDKPGVRSRPGVARTILLFHIISARISVRTIKEGSSLGVYTFGLILVSAEKHLSLSSDIPPVSIFVPPARAGYPHRGQQRPRRPRRCFGRRVPNFQRPPRHLCIVSKVLRPRLPRTRAAYGGDRAAFAQLQATSCVSQQDLFANCVG
jgi:hypothetical protein